MPVPRPNRPAAEVRAPARPPDGRVHQGTYFLGRYRVVDEIGVGGMASVHLARMDGDGGFQKWVAIKKIHPHLLQDEHFVNMFLDEARIAAKISHPNVAQVFELGSHEDTYWIAMEYLQGEPLREVIRHNEENRTCLPPHLAANMGADAAEGLHAAHELRGKKGEPLNLVHRDVSPHNLFLTFDGMVKVVDFGIAKVSGRLSRTRAGTLKGKLAYMSPEQVRGEEIDRRTDIFALGVVLWELTTGMRLFRMDTEIDTLEKVRLCIVPPPSTAKPDFPVELESIIMRALERNPDRRFQSARDMSRALRQFGVRSGKFVGREEVAAYAASVFVDRIKTRQEHLRWAAEVTGTISSSSVDPHSGESDPWRLEPEGTATVQDALVSTMSETIPQGRVSGDVPSGASHERDEEEDTATFRISVVPEPATVRARAVPPAVSSQPSSPAVLVDAALAPPIPRRYSAAEETLKLTSRSQVTPAVYIAATVVSFLVVAIVVAMWMTAK